MAPEVPFDVLETILLGFDMKEITRCKSVCKSWHSFISSPRFVEAHLNHQKKNIINIIRGGHVKARSNHLKKNINIIIGGRIENKDYYCGYHSDHMYVVGSCNGLVCVSPKGAEFEVVNPCTREIKKLQAVSFDQPDEELVKIRELLIMGFGYDASTEDYKVVVGFRKRVKDERTDFYVLALKSNVWKFIGQVNYRRCWNYSATYCGGVLYWFMMAAKKSNVWEKVLMSVDLSTEECKEIPQPAAEVFDHNLGVIEGCLCVYSLKSKEIWVMKNNKWELYNNSKNEDRYDTAHRLTFLSAVDPQNRTGRDVYVIDEGRHVPSADFSTIRTSMFVKSLVSPNPPKWQLEDT